MNFSTLPNLVALSILVLVFWAILRQATTERLHLWLAGWILVLLHFGAQFFGSDEGPWCRMTAAISLDSLVLAGIAFLISVSAIACNRWRQSLFALALAVPSIAYIHGAIWGVSGRGYYYAVVAVGLCACCLLFCYFQRRLDLIAAGMVLGTAVTAAGMAWAAGRDLEWGITVLLSALNFAVAILYWTRYRRATAGVLTAVGGFALWGAVFPTATLLSILVPSNKIESEVWNIPKYLVAVGMILTLLEDQIEKSRYLAYHDELTGLPNRRLLEDRLDLALAAANRTGSKVAVLLLDLDRFKEVNDTFGHRVGDLALQEVVGRLSSRIRASDTLARSGGDEFTVVSYVRDAQGARSLVSSLEAALTAPISVRGEQVQTGLSIGLALYPDDGSDPDQLHSAADRAMYAAKRAARNGSHNGLPQPGPCISTFEHGLQ